MEGKDQHDMRTYKLPCAERESVNEVCRLDIIDVNPSRLEGVNIKNWMRQIAVPSSHRMSTLSSSDDVDHNLLWAKNRDWDFAGARPRCLSLRRDQVMQPRKDGDDPAQALYCISIASRENPANKRRTPLARPSL